LDTKSSRISATSSWNALDYRRVMQEQTKAMLQRKATTKNCNY